MKNILKNKLLLATLGLSASLISVSASAVQTVDAGVPAYEKASGVAGNLSSVGSDTLANLMTLWAEEFNKIYPNVNIQIQAAGSSTAPPA
ncbi:MAG: phosphate-binding protein, partial [Methylococcales bacterium]|nr:phosphate-binding protein [Methylococcales bacterium]